jgi:hypothetical protein
VSFARPPHGSPRLRWRSGGHHGGRQFCRQPARYLAQHAAREAARWTVQPGLAGAGMHSPLATGEADRKSTPGARRPARPTVRAEEDVMAAITGGIRRRRSPTASTRSTNQPGAPAAADRAAASMAERRVGRSGPASSHSMRRAVVQAHSHLITAGLLGGDKVAFSAAEAGPLDLFCGMVSEPVAGTAAGAGYRPGPGPA